MKKYWVIFLVLCMVGTLAVGCSAKETSQSEGTVVDIDLTALSNTMAYAEITNISTDPERYIGKTVKIQGEYRVSYFGAPGVPYHFAILWDETSCCEQGLEFTWDGNHEFPDDFPKEKTKIEVCGVLETYFDQGDTFFRLNVNDITIL